VDKVTSIARKERADSRIYLSHSQNNKKDPLDYKSKYAIASKAFGSIVTRSNARQPVDILKELEKQGYTDVIMVVGSDRLKGMEFIKKYNGKEYNFNSINIVSAGERDPDAEGVEGMSASKMRAAAMAGDFDAFKSGLPPRVKGDAKKIYDQLRSIMEEQLNEFVMDIQQRRARGRLMRRLAKKMARQRKIREKRMADTNRLMARSQKAAKNILRKKLAGERGAHYKELGAAEKIQIDKMVEKKSAVIGKLAKRLMPKIRKAEIARVAAARGQTNEEIDFDLMIEDLFMDEANEFMAEVAQDQDIKDREGSQPKKYFKDLSKSTKTKRDAEFKKGAEKDSDDPSAYPDKHAGDDDAETKPSKYTKKYHQMFGEEEEFELTEESESALKKKAEKSGISYGILKKVYDRGMAAWRTGHRPGATQQQWAYARVNSFITGGKTRSTADADLWRQHKGKAESYKLSEVQEMLRHEGSKWVLYSKDGSKKLGEFDTKEDAMKRERQIQYFKHMEEGTYKRLKDIRKAHLNYEKERSGRGYGYSKTSKIAKDALRDIAKDKDLGKAPLNRYDDDDWVVLDKNNNPVKYAVNMKGKTGNDIGPSNLAPGQKKMQIGDAIRKKYIKEDVAFESVTPKKTFSEMMKKATDREEGTNSLAKSYKKDTPGQSMVEEAEYEGRKVKLNDPFRLPAGSKKKFGVYVKNDKGNVVKVTFGDPNMEIKRDDPERRKAFRSRHSCDDDIGPKWKARYWSCYQWRAGKKVDN